MIAPWIVEEMKTADLQDKRLNQRMTEVLSDLAERPCASIPAACGGHAETVVAYRFFDNEKVTYQGVLQPHVEATRRRLANEEVVLLVQDTIEKKESFRWLEGLRQARQVAQDLPAVQCVCVGDSDTLEEVRQIIQYYCVRWMIEVLYRTLKSGCRVEERLFEHIDRLLPCVAIYLIVAWRTLMLVRLGRSSPDMDCEAVFEPSEWKSVWMVIHRPPPPRKPPKLAAMLRLVAQLGGYVNRPNRSDPPGPQTTWLGLQRMHDLAWAWDTFGPGAVTNPKLV